MGIQTVKGVIAKETLGVTTPHEHALIDIRNQYPGEPAPGTLGWDGLVSKEHYDLLMSDPYALRDNLVLEDEALAIAEVGAFAKAGGQAFVDVTPYGIGRNPQFLKRLSDETGLHVVAACGYYTGDAHPAAVADLSVEALADTMIRELTEGIDGTNIKAGIIGEIGTSFTLSDGEIKVLHASAIAHLKTGAPVMVHLCPWSQHGMTVVDILVADGVKPDRICLCHTDVLLDAADMKQLLARGIYLEFDNFGKLFTSGSAYGRFPSDEERLDVLYQLIDAGYADQLLLSCDICLKNLLLVHDGPGYAHILVKMAEKIRQHYENGDAIVQKLLVANPANYLDNPKLTL